MSKQTYTFRQFINNINENYFDGEALLKKEVKEAIENIVDLLIKEGIEIIGAPSLSSRIRKRENGFFYLDVEKANLTMREIPEEIDYILSNNKYETVFLEENERYEDKNLIKINNSLSILIEYRAHSERIYINPLYKDRIKAIEMDQQEMPDLENARGQIWNGKNIIEVNFDFNEITSEGKEYGFYATYFSVNSPDNKNYDLNLGFSGSKDDWEYDDIEDLEPGRA